MKKFTICTLLLIFTATSFCQPANPPQTLTRADYLKKSKTQKIAAWVLLGAGATMFIIAAPGNASFGTLGTLVIVGAVSTLSSIPLFIASGRNKRKALKTSAYLKFEKIPSVQHVFTSLPAYPAIALKIPL